MFQYRQGRFYIPGASVAIPDNFFFNTEPENYMKECITLRSPDHDYELIFYVYDEKEQTDVALQKFLNKIENLTSFQPVSPLLINGLAGHYTVYASFRYSYYETRFQLSKNRQLVILVETKGHSNIKRIIASDIFKATMNSIRAEKK